MDTLDALHLVVLEAVVARQPAGVEDVLDWLGTAPVDADTVAGVLDDLAVRGLVWGPPDPVRAVGTVAQLIGPYPGGLGRSIERLRDDGVDVAAVDLAHVADRIAAIPAEGRRLLEHLADGPPVADVTDVRFGRPDDPLRLLVDALVADGLLVRPDPAAIELPEPIGLALRGGSPLRGAPFAVPPVDVAAAEPGDLDVSAGPAVLDSLRQLEELGRLWSDEPPPQLRSGGLGVRELRRSARELDVDEPHLALLAELLLAADLIGAPTAREFPWRPTTDFDTWADQVPADRWLRVAQAWLTMTRQPSLVGERDERGKARAALSFEIERSAAPSMRRDVLGLLAGLPSGSLRGGVDVVLARLAWTRPRRIRALDAPARATLAEAEWLGITAGGGLTGFGRALLSGGPTAARDPLAAALPEPVGHFLLQPDLSLVVPGPPGADLARELALIADLESAGGASVYRVSEASVRRALDAGRSAAQVHELFTGRSRTPVPQSLTYLVDDLARRHGALRVGTAESYLRCDDEALLDRVVSDRATAPLGLRRLAPTVALAAAEPDTVLSVLREAGYVPAAEDATGAVVSAKPPPERVRPRRSASARAVAAEPIPDERLDELVRRMRTGDEMARTAHHVGQVQSVPGVTSARTFEVLRQAIRADHHVWVSHVDSSGAPRTSVLEPLSLGGGFLRGRDAEGGEFRSIPLHRITSVNVVRD